MNIDTINHQLTSDQSCSTLYSDAYGPINIFLIFIMEKIGPQVRHIV